MHGDINAPNVSTASPLAAVNSANIPLVVHVIYRLDTGGLENGVVNLINRIPADRFRHAIICLTTYSDFRLRLRRSDVAVFALNKPPGNSLIMLMRLWWLLRKLRPDIVHTRNLAALDATIPAALAGVQVRIHGEHGRDLADLDGNNAARQRLRRFFKPFIHRYVALSKDLENYLREKIGVPSAKIAQLYNGVDTVVFHPTSVARDPLPEAGFASTEAYVIGTVGRMQSEKDQMTLARAFVALSQMVPPSERQLRLVMIGDGPQRAPAVELLRRAGLSNLAWLPGDRNDVAEIMRGLDLFVLPSLAEGISNTILEAMATGLPVVATSVGGNPELVVDGHTGALVPPSDPNTMASAIRDYVMNPEKGKRHGSAARIRAEQCFGLDIMVKNYTDLYDQALMRDRAPLCVQPQERA
jgi:sugar transferase (PEP-CTERM/EpsH1 system associated)